MDNIMTNLGENFEYFRTIAQNKVELKKLDILENTSNVVSYFILSLVALILTAFFSVISLIGITMWLAYLLNSYIIATFITASSIFLLLMLIIFFRHKLIFRPIKNLLFSSTLGTED